MGTDRDCKETPTIRRLTRQEIEDRLDRVIAEVGGWTTGDGEEERKVGPRWISSAELVRKVRPFIVYN